MAPTRLADEQAEFVSFRVLELFADSGEDERYTLGVRKIARLLAPWVTESPIFFHATDSTTPGFQSEVDQIANAGFEMIIYSFGSGFNLETADPAYLAAIKSQVAYANSKGVADVGGYDLICQDRGHGGYGGDVGAEWDTVGADGSLRMFDLRDLEHSTIMYETVAGGGALLRLGWNKQDPNFLATFSQDSAKTAILDIRMPAVAVCELGGHVASVNGIAWAPHSSCHICTVGDDIQALIWDLSALGSKPVEDPILAYTAEAEINNVVWSAALPDWVTVLFANKMQILRV
jgi:hypothetical protein